MRVAILGGGSCFAMNLAYQYIRKDVEVLSISRSPMRGPAFTYGLEFKQGFDYKVAHIGKELDRVMYMLGMFKPDVVVNFAALCEVGLSWKHALDYYETNLMSLVRLTDALASCTWFRKFVQIGSSEVYGSVSAPAKESTAYNPSSPYAASKAVFDFHLRAIARHKGFPAIIAMPSNGYCEGQTMNRIIPRAIVCAMTGEKLTLQGGGVAMKSYLHGDDISRGIMVASDYGEYGGTYNIGPSAPISIAELVTRVAFRFGKTLEDIAEVGPERTGQDSLYLLDSNVIRAMGWRPEVRFEEGLDRMIGWIRKHPELLKMNPTYEHRA